MELGEVVQDVFAVWEAEKNGACGAIQTLLALPKPGGDRLRRRPGRQEASASIGIAGGIAS